MTGRGWRRAGWRGWKRLRSRWRKPQPAGFHDGEDCGAVLTAGVILETEAAQSWCGKKWPMPVVRAAVCDDAAQGFVIFQREIRIPGVRRRGGTAARIRLCCGLENGAARPTVAMWPFRFRASYFFRHSDIELRIPGWIRTPKSNLGGGPPCRPWRRAARPGGKNFRISAVKDCTRVVQSFGRVSGRQECRRPCGVGVRVQLIAHERTGSADAGSSASFRAD